MDIPKDLGKLKDIVSTYAPLLGGVLGGRYYAVAVNLLSQLLGADGSVPDILSKVSSDKDVHLRLKQIENQHCEMLVKLSNESFGLESTDRQDARKRERELHDSVPTVLALGYLFIYALFQFYTTTHVQTSGDNMNITRLQDGLMYILGYYFGGMHKKKDDQHG